MRIDMVLEIEFDWQYADMCIVTINHVADDVEDKYIFGFVLMCTESNTKI